ncbi:MAG: ABC transporter permease [Gammaproteobacteria bacterium]|nr:ABC transporter permease [Gammaproteobacteria bacterium]
MFSIRELIQEKTRLFLTILAIAWGTFTISSMLAVGEGLRVTFQTAVANAGYNLLSVMGEGRSSKNYLGQHANQIINLLERDYNLIKKLPEIAQISPVQSVRNIKFTYRDKTRREPLLAVNSQYAKIHSIDMASGRFISSLDIKNRSAVIVLGTKTYEDFFPDKIDPIGKIIKLNGNAFLIIGLMQEKSQLTGTDQPDFFTNWIPISTYETVANPQSIDSISITYKNSEKLDILKKQIQQIVALNHHVDPNDENIINFSDIAKQQKTITDFFLGLQIFLGIVGALTLLVAGVGIANVMYASVTRSTAEIGIRMAVGAKTYQIFLMYIGQSVAATIIGGILGILLTTIFVAGMKYLPLSGRLIETIGKPLPVLSWTVVFIVIFVLGLIGFLSGLFPAMKAASIDPAEALIYE